MSEGQEVPDWIDMDRYEDWERPTLETLCPAIRIPFEEDLFPIAVAEDGESLPSEIHPSHPYGNLHHHSLPYTSRFKLPPRRGLGHQSGEEPIQRDSQTDGASMPLHLGLRARQTIAPNTPVWPFRRYGPGPGGPNALQRAESKRPWRPYKAVWADLGLEELLPVGPSVKGERLQGERADLPPASDGQDMQAVLQDLAEFDAVHLHLGEDDGTTRDKGKKGRRAQEQWKWGQSARQG